jgi:biotin transport system substrate-specific component
MISQSILSKDIVNNKAVCRVFGVLTFVLLTALGAYVRVPLGFTPVPLTLQTSFVILSGAVLGRHLGALSQFIYILIGVFGFSLFANSGSGVFYLLGPTTGYLFGFVLSSFLVGRLLKKNNNQGLLMSFVYFYCGAASILLCGALGLVLVFKLTLAKAFVLGVMPFIFADAAKSLAAAIIYTKISKRAREIL